MSIVKYHNQFNSLPLKGFTSTEMDLLMALFSSFRDNGSRRKKILFSDIKKMSGWEKANGIDNAKRAKKISVKKADK